MVSAAQTRPARGEAWLVNLHSTSGREIQTTRPCVGVSPSEINAHLSTKLMAQLTSASRPAPFRMATRFAGQSGLLLLEQIRTVDARRLVKKVGQLDSLTLNAALALLRSLFSE